MNILDKSAILNRIKELKQPVDMSNLNCGEQDGYQDSIDAELDDLKWCLKFHEENRKPVKQEKEYYYDIVIDLYEEVLLSHRENKW